MSLVAMGLKGGEVVRAGSGIATAMRPKCDRQAAGSPTIKRTFN
jgi:hypothetical protein